MLRSLRWKLTLAFVLVIFLFTAAVVVGGYFVLSRNYDQTVDLDLRYRMAIQYQFYGFDLPPDLQVAVDQWNEEQAGALGLARFNPAAFTHQLLEGEDHEEREIEDDEDESEEEHEYEEGEDYEIEELLEGAYSSDLALIFLFPLDERCRLISDPNPFDAPISPLAPACQSALQNGRDLRTVHFEDGERVRLLTYRVDTSFGPDVIQAGRSLADQDRALAQLLLGVSGFGLLLMLVAGISSWWLAGRSLGPAQRAWDQQRAFIANASHELRTPLTLMRASAEVALRGKVGAKEQERLQDIIQEADYMGSLVDDLLLLSRLDSGRLQLERERIDLGKLMGEIQRQMALMASDHDFVSSDQIPAPHLRADPVRLRQILLILLDNAIQHTPKGSRIELRVAVEGKQVLFTVRDSGPGIPPEHLPHIFERFYQAASEPEGVERSNGLGLSIAQGLAELHGGQLRAWNDGGAVFELSLPLR